MKVRKPFTLLELVTVIIILGLTASFAVSTIRKESPAAKMREASLRFEAFCSSVRLQAMEDGCEKIVLFYPEEMLCRVKGEPEAGRTLLKWKIPDGFQLEYGKENIETDDTGACELFYYFADGSACGKRTFELKCGDLSSKYEVSPLTGLFIVKEETK